MRYPAQQPSAAWRGLTRPVYVSPLGIAPGAPTPVPVPEGAIAPQAPTGLEAMSRQAKIILTIVVVLALLYAAYRLGKASAPTPMQSVRKMSTNRLSRALYERLEANGKGSERTRSALAQLGR